MQRVSFNVKRTASVIASLMVCSVLIIMVLFHHTTVVNGINPQMDNRKSDAEFRHIRETTKEGSFIDRNGYPITYADKKGVPATIEDSYAFSPLIGYNSIIYGVSGLRDKFSEHLFKGGKDSTGADIKLTIDSSLQKFCYDLLDESEGSCVVLDSDTGEILALVSRSGTAEFDANNIDDLYSTYVTIDGFFLNRATRAVDPPGSTFKIVTATSMIENGKENYIYEDNGFYKIGNNTYYNFDKRKFGTTDLLLAMKKSSNVYFASSGVELGSEKLYNTAKKYMYGESIELDFCTLYSNFEKSDISNPSTLAETSFGQGTTLISPLQLCMQIQSIMNNEGVMLKPYLIQSITNDEKTEYSGKTETLTKATDSTTAKKLYELLSETAKDYRLYDADSGSVIAKTGTADLYNGTNAIYITCGFTTEDTRYAICISKRNTNETSSSLIPATNTLLEYLK